MANVCYWIPQVGVLLSLFTLITAQQPGFLNINCGGTTNHTAENNIRWVTDANYIDVGKTADIGNVTEAALGSSLDSLRYFPKPLNKSCYHLPVPSNVPYLLRLWFLIGNYSGYQSLPSFAFSFETSDMLVMQNMTLTPSMKPIYDERIFVTSDTVMYVCLIRTFESDDPFISGIELRTLQDGMYPQGKPGTGLHAQSRIDVGGGNSILRYPQDKFDRIWTSDITLDSTDLNFYQSVTSDVSISTNNTKNHPPTAVMQTAWVGHSSNGFRFLQTSALGSNSSLMLYFAELEMVEMSEYTSFEVVVNEETRTPITLPGNNDAVEEIFALVPSQSETFSLSSAADSTYPPIINAFEYYSLFETQRPTHPKDTEALEAIKRSFDIKDWVSDPCYVIPWKGIRCDNNSSVVRISEIDLSRRNLTGSLPKDIEQLTALVTVSFNNNYFMGPLSNYSNLTMLERLYLQNNNLNGTVPEWLSQLKNLKELNIANNNFSGAIPVQLLRNCSLKLNYSGNRYLRMDQRECVPYNSNSSNSTAPNSNDNKNNSTTPNSNNNNKNNLVADNSNNDNLKLIVGTTLSGILITALGTMVGIALYRNKWRRNRQGGANGSKDYSIITVPNTTNSRAFTLDEMVTATQNYNRKIGQGGFGSVFLGNLSEGKVIAVKVLSLFSKQGVREFLNEVDLLSKINHRNLVSLLGYCNETREVMLVYEYMSGGSLKDHLYGSSSEETELSWKTRLKIAMDAAQGLEYLHVGSTSKIIHRDIKSANILLDSNMNGKLADFGLSRMTIDGEATHVTTAVKGTFGYLDPEYYITQRLTEKSDVYSFGVVLLEIICGRPPIDLKLPEHELNIVRWVTPYLLDMDENHVLEVDEIGGRIAEIIDKRLDGSYELKSITHVARVAMRCVEAKPSLRPSVSEVARELKKAMKIEEKASISVAEDIDIKSVDLSVTALSLSMDWRGRKGMEWSENSSNPSNVGR